jgi:hypothetical protein
MLLSKLPSCWFLEGSGARWGTVLERRDRRIELRWKESGQARPGSALCVHTLLGL